jgi:HlyD family secretion protein
MKRRKKSFLIIALVLMGLAAGGYFFFWKAGPNGSNGKYRVMQVERGNISSSVTATGTINPVVTVLVGSQVSGTIKALHADFNSRVKEGDIIAQIDPAIFQAQVDQARANVATAQANLANAQANLQSLQANLVKAEVTVSDSKRTLDRNLQLMKMSAIAQAALDTAQANYDSAVAQRDANRAQLEVAKAQIESAKAQIEHDKAALKMAETNLRYATIRSPVNGTVISRNVDVGQTVAASLQAPTLFTIAKDLTEMQVDTNFSEADIGKIEKGQEATFTVDAYPEQPFRGKVFEIRNAPQTIQNVVTYDVVIQVGNKDLKLKPGMTANVSIVIAHREGVLKIPNAALRFQPANVNRGTEAEAKTKEAGSGGRPSPAQFTEGLNLTQDQQAKVEMILKASRTEIQEIRQNSKPEEARGKIQSLIRQKIMDILTPEQKQKLTELSQAPQSEQKKSVRIWVLSPQGKLAPLSVLVGITDGTFSEVTSGDLKEGTEVIVEELSKNKGSNPGSARPPTMRFGR